MRRDKRGGSAHAGTDPPFFLHLPVTGDRLTPRLNRNNADALMGVAGP